jgi:hypothetical protein
MNLNECLLTILFWHSYEFLQTFDSCEFLVWDDELHEVNAANGGGQSAATMQLGAEFGKAFGQQFGKAYGEEFGKAFGEEFGKGLQEFSKAYGQQFGKAYGVEFGKVFGQEIGNKLAQFVWVAIIMCGILVDMLFKSM